jgi:hypothetical protein
MTPNLGLLKVLSSWDCTRLSAKGDCECSGLVMFAFITIHLFNHTLGVVSLALAESGLRVEMVFWRSPPITFLLYGAAAIIFH